MSDRRWLVIKASKALLSSDSQVAPASVLVDRSTGKIVKVVQGQEELQQEDAEVLELSPSQVLFPGLLDAHGNQVG